jgi:hypothetical protein
MGAQGKLFPKISLSAELSIGGKSRSKGMETIYIYFFSLQPLLPFCLVENRQFQPADVVMRGCQLTNSCPHMKPRKHRPTSVFSAQPNTERRDGGRTTEGISYSP